VFKKGSFKKGLKDGAWSIYDDRGEMMDEVTFKAGRSV
jgi:antitoxin component YwqK of YwqJK toxin-antitoxin module